MLDKTLLLDLTYNKLKELLVSWGEPAYRADQIWSWLYRSLASDFQEMTNLPKELRERLAEATLLRTMKPLEEKVSADGLTRKVLFALRDDQTIESVFMLYEKRRTACISTQVGCPIGCPFCATGQSGFVRNLTPGEIVEQVLYFARQLREGGKSNELRVTRKVDPSLVPRHSSLTNVVFMGMGEPLANYEATWQAIETLTHDDGFNLGARRITISTVGLVPGLRPVADDGRPFFAYPHPGSFGGGYRRIPVRGGETGAGHLRPGISQNGSRQRRGGCHWRPPGDRYPGWTEGWPEHHPGSFGRYQPARAGELHHQTGPGLRGREAIV